MAKRERCILVTLAKATKIAFTGVSKFQNN